MKKSTLILLGLIFIFSCSNRQVKQDSNCFVNYDSLLNTLDTSRLKIQSFGMHDSLEVMDTSVYSGEGSVFHFDSQGRLGLYAFMVDWPVTNFMILYDSTGRKTRVQSNEVVRWEYNKPKSDTFFNLTVLLCAVDRNYGGLRLEAGGFVDTTIKLYKSAFSKLICFRKSIPIERNMDSLKVLLSGETMEKCGGEIFFFSDSTVLELK